MSHTITSRTLFVVLCCWMAVTSVGLTDDNPDLSQSFKHQITGLFSVDRVRDLEATVEKLPGIKLVSVNFDTAEATFQYDSAAVFPNQASKKVIEEFDNRLRNASRHTFGIKPLCTTPRDQMKLVQIEVVGLDCKACCLVAYESIYKLEGVEQATASFKDGLVTAWIHPDKTDREKLEDALAKRNVNLKSRAEKPANPEIKPSEPASKEETEDVMPIICLDLNKKPVAGAEVYVFQYSGFAKRYREFGPLKTDPDGKAICNAKLFSNDHGNFDRWFYARLPGKLVGCARSSRWTGRSEFNTEGRVKMIPSHSIEGQVTVPPEFDVTKVTIKIQTLHFIWGDGFFDYDSFPRDESFSGLHTSLPQFFDRRPGPDGRIRFDDIPDRGNMYLITIGEGLAEAQWRNANKKTDQPVELNLVRESFLGGKVVQPDGKPAGGLKVNARLQSSAQGPMYLSSFVATTDHNGDFAIHGLPQLEFVLSVNDPKKRWTFHPMVNQLVQSDDERNVKLKMETGTLVSGRVVDSSGKPVHSAGFSALVDSPPGPGLDHVSTDETGRYQFRLPAGKSQLYFNSLPDGLAYPDPQIVKKLDITSGQADIENLDFTIPIAVPPSKD